MTEDEKKFAEEVIEVFRRHGKVLRWDHILGWFIEGLESDAIPEIQKELGLTP